MIEARLPERTQSVNLEENSFLLHQILNHISEGLLFIRFDGVITLLNPSALKILKLPKGAFSKRYSELFTDDFFGFSMREALKFCISYRLLYKTWMDRELEISTTFLFEGAKKEHGLLLFVRDITEIKRLQLTANRNDKIKELGAMTASIAHEIRNPLGGIRGFGMLLYRDLVQQPHLQEMAASIIEGTKSMERLVGTILHYARPVNVQLRSIELGQYLKQLVKFIKADPAFPGLVSLMTHIPDEPLLIPFDQELLKSAILNLVFNAFQAMPQGGILTLTLMKGETHGQITLSDTGIGMSEEQLCHLFTPFFTTKQKGNGLGLVETQKIIEAHGGTIEVRSALGKGSTFVLSLPLKRGLL